MTRAKVDTSILDEFEPHTHKFQPERSLSSDYYAILLEGVAEGRSAATLAKFVKSCGVSVSESAVRRWRAGL